MAYPRSDNARSGVPVDKGQYPIEDPIPTGSKTYSATITATPAPNTLSNTGPITSAPMSLGTQMNIPTSQVQHASAAANALSGILTNHYVVNGQ